MNIEAIQRKQISLSECLGLDILVVVSEIIPVLGTKGHPHFQAYKGVQFGPEGAPDDLTKIGSGYTLRMAVENLCYKLSRPHVKVVPTDDELLEIERAASNT